MVDFEDRLGKLEEKVKEIEIGITKSLGKIEKDLIEIKSYVKSNSGNDDLKNDLIKKDVKANSDRITRLEEIVSKICWTVALSIFTLVGGAVIYYIKNGI